MGISVPFFFENEQEEAVTINGNRYRAMLNKFQQNSATCHTAEATHDVLRPVFDHRIISHIHFDVTSFGNF